MIPKLTIITPTILRESLRDACGVIDRMQYKNWEHIVMVDMRRDQPTEQQRKLLEDIKHEQRIIKFCGRKHNNYGNTCRHIACGVATGDFIGFNDDDDRFVEDAFSVIVEELIRIKTVPDAIYYPAMRHGSIFFNHPPGSCMTVTGQYMVRPVIAGERIAWPKVADNDIGYLYDGEFIESIKRKTKFTPISQNRFLYIVEQPSHGQ